MTLSPAERGSLTACFLFQGLGGDEISALLEAVPHTSARFARGEAIYAPRQFQKDLGILLSGRVRVSKGNGSLVVSALAPGDIFGAAALFNDEPEYVSLLTALAPCGVLFLPQDSVKTLLARDGRVAENYIRYLSGRIRFLSHKVDVLIQSSGQQKLAKVLLESADGDGRIQLPCPMSELAARLNMSRAALYREVGKLEEAGLLLRQGKQLQLLRREDWALR